MLNKIMGCESPTVPPLYVLKMFRGENRSLEAIPGRLKTSKEMQPSFMA